MHWDCSLNKDVWDAFIRHQELTEHLDQSDQREFCSSTPKRMESGFLRIMDPDLGPDAGCPTSGRIIQDFAWGLISWL